MELNFCIAIILTKKLMEKKNFLRYSKCKPAARDRKHAKPIKYTIRPSRRCYTRKLIEK